MKTNIKLLIGLWLFTTLLFSCGEDKIDLVRTGSIEGTVIDKETRVPIADVTVSVNSGSSTTTDINGIYRLEVVPEGSQSVQATKEGYVTKFEGVTVTENGTTTRIFELEKNQNDNRPPDSLELITPINNATEIDRLPQFIWTASDPDDDELTFDLILIESATGNQMTFENIADTTFTLGSDDLLKFDTRYTWQIVAKDGFNQNINSNVFSFTTVPFPAENNIFYTREINDNFVIFAADDEGMNEVQITSSRVSSWRPRQNPIKNKVAFLQVVGAETHIFTMDRNGENSMQVTLNNPPAAGFRATEIDYTWTENGNKLVYPSFRRLYEINADGSGLQEIYAVPDGEFITEIADLKGQANSADYALKVNNSDGYNAKIFTIDSDGNEIDTILNNVNGAVGGLDFTRGANNINWLLYSRDVDGEENSDYSQLRTRIFIYDFDSAQTFQISGDLNPGDDTDVGNNHLDPRFDPNYTKVILTQQERALNSTANPRVATLTIPDLSDPTDVQTNGVVSHIENGQMADWRP